MEVCIPCLGVCLFLGAVVAMLIYTGTTRGWFPAACPGQDYFEDEEDEFGWGDEA